MPRACITVTAVALALLVPSDLVAQTQRTAASNVSVPVSDARNVGAKSVRFSAAQFTRDAPSVLIFGVTKANWPKLRAAIEQAVVDGYPVAGIFIGPDNEPANIEIYAKGIHVTNPIDPNTVSGPRLTEIIKAVYRDNFR